MKKFKNMLNNVLKKQMLKLYQELHMLENGNLLQLISVLMVVNLLQQ
jgi:hypothetical protein